MYHYYENIKFFKPFVGAPYISSKTIKLSLTTTACGISFKYLSAKNDMVRNVIGSTLHFN